MRSKLRQKLCNVYKLNYMLALQYNVSSVKLKQNARLKWIAQHWNYPLHVSVQHISFRKDNAYIWQLCMYN